MTDHPALSVLPEVPTREQLEAFGQRLQTLEGSPDLPNIDAVHHFAGDVYGRTVVIQAESFLVGLPHKEDHICVSVGDITVWTETGRQRLTGAHVVNARAGALWVAFAHEDTSWLSVHVNRTGGQDPRAIEDALLESPDRLLNRRRGVAA
jgi:hypothetical protein